MTNIQYSGRWTFLAAVLLAGARASEPFPGPPTETILSTYHVRPGQEAAFVAAINHTWEVYRKLDAVLPSPHSLVRRVSETGDVMFIELFTWRSGDIPDHAPPEIKTVWKQLEALCKRPDGKSGIEGDEVTVLAFH